MTLSTSRASAIALVTAACLTAPPLGAQAPADITIDFNFPLTTSFTVPSDWILRFGSNGRLTLATGVVLQIQGAVVAPQVQIFDGPGIVQFTGPGTKQLCPQWWGARGDGIADDTQAVQSALDQLAIAPGGGEVYFPRGQYLVGNLSITGKQFVLRGEGRRSTKILGRTGRSGPIFSIGTLGIDTNYIEVRGLFIHGGDRSRDGLSLEHVSESHFEDVHVESCNTGVWAGNTLVCEFDSCHFNQNEYGFRSISTSPGSTPETNLLRIRDTSISRNAVYGIVHRSGTMFVLDGCDIEHNGNGDPLASGGVWIDVRNFPPRGGIDAQVVIRDTWFEQNQGRGLRCNGGRVTLDNAYFVQNMQAALIADIRSVTLRDTYSPSGSLFDVNNVSPTAQVLVLNSEIPGAVLPPQTVRLP